MMRDGFPPKKVLNVRDFILMYARNISNNPKRLKGIIVCHKHLSIFLMKIVTNSAIKFYMIK